MKKMMAALLALTLGACEGRPEHAEWQDRCVSSHLEAIPTSQFVPDGRGGGTVIMTATTIPVCDRTEPVCVWGTDGSTVCPA